MPLYNFLTSSDIGTLSLQMLGLESYIIRQTLMAEKSLLNYVFIK